MMNLQTLKKRLGFVFPPSTKVDAVAEYVADFDIVLASMGGDEKELLSAIDANWELWRPSYNSKKR